MGRSAKSGGRAKQSGCVGRSLRSIGKCEVEGPALVSLQPITFLGFLNRRTGLVEQRGHPLFGQNVASKILVFPRGIGSTVGPYVLLEMAENGVAPLGLVMHRGDLGTIAAASLAKIPLLYDAEPDPTSRFATGTKIRLRISDGQGRLTGSEPQDQRPSSSRRRP